MQVKTFVAANSESLDEQLNAFADKKMKEGRANVRIVVHSPVGERQMGVFMLSWSGYVTWNEQEGELR